MVYVALQAAGVGNQNPHDAALTAAASVRKAMKEKAWAFVGNRVQHL